MKLFVLQVGVLLLVSAPLFAQIETIPDAYGSPMRGRKANVDGNVYTTSEWVRGDVEWNNGDTSKDLPLKYNTLTGNVEVKKDGTSWEYSQSHIKKFKYEVLMYPDVVTYTFLPAKQFLEQPGFVEMLFSSKVSLFKVIKTQVISGTASYGVSQSTERIIQTPQTYMAFPDKEVSLIKLKNNAFIKLVQKKNPSIKLKDFINQYSLNVTRAEDLEKVMDFIDSHYN